jgi:hypothetical protein
MKSDLATAYAMSRRARKNKMAQGGEALPKDQDVQNSNKSNEPSAPRMRPNQDAHIDADGKAHGFASGGMVKGKPAPDHDHKSMIDAIRCKMSSGGMCGYADGGLVEEGLPEHEDFLSDEADTEAPDNDQMNDEAGEIEGEGEDRKKLLSKIMAKHMMNK